MNRTLIIAAVILIASSNSTAAEPPIDSIDRALLVQKAMADAKDYLIADDPASASAVLEAQLQHANVNRSFLELLCKAYHSEQDRLRLSPTPDLKRLESIAKRLAILEGGTRKETAPPLAKKPETEMPLAPPAILPQAIVEPAGGIPRAPEPIAPAVNQNAEWLKTATSLFNRGKTEPACYREAAELFAKVYVASKTLTPEQHSAWAYCRIRIAAEKLNEPTANAEMAKAMEADVNEALSLAPYNAGLQKAAQSVLASAHSIMGTKAAANPAPAFQPIVPAVHTSPVAKANEIAGPGVVVKHSGQVELATAIAKAVESQRKAITEKWFGPAGAAWSPVCEITLHANGESFAAATKLSDRATGRAEVALENGAVKSRRIDLRADDEALLTVSLPRELAHIVLADLFPNKPPPRWAEEAIAVLSSTPAEVERYKRAAPRLAVDGALPPADQLLTSTGFPTAERITGFYVASVSIVDYLVTKKGEKAFATFLTDSQRYGIESAFKRQYGMSLQQLDAAWRKNASIR